MSSRQNAGQRGSVSRWSAVDTQPLKVKPRTEFFLQRWNDFLADAELLRRPERIEIDGFGRFLLSPPPDALHRKQGFRITALLEALLPGDGAYPEQSILTPKGIRIADAIWLDPSRLHELSRAPNQPLSPAPNICVKILSTEAEIDEQRALYFAAGAREVWICDRDSHIRFFAPEGQLDLITLSQVP